MLSQIVKNLPKTNYLNKRLNLNTFATNFYNYIFKYNLYEKAFEHKLNEKYERENEKANLDLLSIQNNHKWHVQNNWSTLKVINYILNYYKFRKKVIVIY